MKYSLTPKVGTVWGRGQTAMAGLAGANLVFLASMLSRDSLPLALLFAGLCLAFALPVLIAGLLVHHFELEFGMAINATPTDILLGIAVILSLAGFVAALSHLSLWVGGVAGLGIAIGARYAVWSGRVLASQSKHTTSQSEL